MRLQNTMHGLMPCMDEDYEVKRKLKIGAIYEVEIKQARNYDFFKKYHALISCAYEFLTERQKEFIGSKENFRKTLQIAAGWSETYYSIQRKEWIEESKSISFGAMSEAEFSELYDNVKNVLFATFLRHISQDEFMKELINF